MPLSLMPLPGVKESRAQCGCEVIAELALTSRSAMVVDDKGEKAGGICAGTESYQGPGSVWEWLKLMHGKIEAVVDKAFSWALRFTIFHTCAKRRPVVSAPGK